MGSRRCLFNRTMVVMSKRKGSKCTVGLDLPRVRVAPDTLRTKICIADIEESIEKDEEFSIRDSFW